MANGAESRMPFMDWRLVCFSFSLHQLSKIGNGYTKRILRQSINILNNDVRLRRDKIGWNAPLHNWLSSELGFEIDLKLKKDKNLHELIGKDWANFRKIPSPSFLDGQLVWQKLLPYLWKSMISKIN